MQDGDELIAVLTEGNEALMEELVTGVPTGDPATAQPAGGNGA